MPDLHCTAELMCGIRHDYRCRRYEKRSNILYEGVGLGIGDNRLKLRVFRSLQSNFSRQSIHVI
jgi:hypothetical protein